MINLAQQRSIIESYEGVAKNFHQFITPSVQNISAVSAASVLKEEEGAEAEGQDEDEEADVTFLSTAKSLTPVTDKVTTHRYDIMYDMFLVPYYKKKTNMKMLEIGLGCDMNYGPGASVQVWKKLFPKAELWEAEYVAECVKKAKERGQLDGIHTLVGDQGNTTVLDGWIQESGGEFDVIIDDGGHKNCQIYTSFMKLWPTVKPGGLYFIEDMQIAKRRYAGNYENEICKRDLIFPNELKKFVDRLMYTGARNPEARMNVKFLFCQPEACVIGKE